MIAWFVQLVTLNPGQIIEPLVANVGSSMIRKFDAKDSEGNGLDCIKIIEIGPHDYLGVCHSVSGGIFRARLVRSSNLVDWARVVTLDDHAHQPTIQKVGAKFVLAWEKDGPAGNWIRVRAYDSLANLISGVSAAQADLPRTLSPSAEGTPSFDGITLGNSWANSTIALRHHYYRNSDVDRQAAGRLTGFSNWTSSAVAEGTSTLEKIYHGNMGDRDSLDFLGRKFDLMEAQITKNDWASWRILMRQRGKAYKQLPIQTPGGSTSFANPTWTLLHLPNGRSGLVVTLFIPSEGAAPGEAGELIYATEMPEIDASKQ